ncbi:sensor histidine kinase [Maridesulfovibrio hydrothermalis]|uniref:histidine kinase n=1 Tax=Maridesulfovibrio hydrothermalis AM13 = DSM 14728 TaxID=1121451 RepID=L0REE3_9BACT|nr:ATP-binding protein [Maridesulfovibrio hydrothermalis]CCO24560.1 PAS/PAC sensor signal transduction histidine kinase [Maridesulfovibrio hydrothermalis AM13 = DSM 14728]
MPSFNSLIIENIIESLDVGLMVISHEGKIVFLNTAICNILDLSCDKHIGFGWGELFITDEVFNSEFNQVIIDVINKKTIGLKHIVPYKLKNRKCPKRLSITSSFLTENENIIGMVFLFEDVTEIYNAEEREKKILSRNAELQKERIEGLDSLAQAVAHQVLNPATVIGGMANLVSRKLPESDPLKKDIQIISEEAIKLEGLVAAVHTYSNIPKPVPVEVNTEDLFKQANEDANRILERIGECIEMKFECSVDSIIVGKKLFQAAIVELLLNASNFTPEKITDVRVQVTRKSGTIFIKMIDHGMGIERHQLNHVLDPFFSTKAKGVGMGLSRVNKIVFEHQGKLHIESQGANKGTTVTIELPCPDAECCNKNGNSDQPKKVLNNSLI